MDQLPTQKELEREAQAMLLIIILMAVVVAGLHLFAAWRDQRQDPQKWIEEQRVERRQTQ